MTASAPIAALLSDLRLAGVELAVRDGRLLYRPRHVDPGIAARISAHKADLIDALGDDDATRAFALPDPTARTRRHDECRWCRRSLWWAVRSTDELWTCGFCHPPHPILGRVLWRGHDTPTVTVTEDRP